MDEWAQVAELDQLLVAIEEAIVKRKAAHARELAELQRLQQEKSEEIQHLQRLAEKDNVRELAEKKEMLAREQKLIAKLALDIANRTKQ